MSTKRIWLRLPEDNPIWDVPSGMRSEITDQWLRQADVLERLERAAGTIER